MSETPSEPARTRDFERFLTFVDAIVAIAVTLLVLPLVDVVNDLQKEHESVSKLLGDNRALIGAFFLSFVVIANLWLNQHRVLTHVIASNELLTRLLTAWSLTIVFLPFPTALVAGPGSAGEEALTKLLYVGSMAVSSLLLALVCLVVSRDRSLRDGDDGPDPAMAFAVAIAFVVALAVMLLVPATSYWPLLLLLVSDRAVDVYRRTVDR